MEAIPSIVSESPAPIEKRRLLSDLKDDAAHKGCCGSLRRHGFYVFALSVVAALGIALIAIAVLVVAGVLAGLMPAWRAASIQPARAIQEGG